MVPLPENKINSESKARMENKEENRDKWDDQAFISLIMLHWLNQCLVVDFLDWYQI